MVSALVIGLTRFRESSASIVVSFLEKNLLVEALVIDLTRFRESSASIVVSFLEKNLLVEALAAAKVWLLYTFDTIGFEILWI
jgi:hypothetical protein